ncbi:MAG: hypothetical protein IJR50_08725 [Treponema sp.]|nr:hypothetical protein [Treponema sp.]
MHNFTDSSFFNNLKELYTGSRKHIAYLSSALVLLVCIALIIFIVQKTRKPKTIERFERELVTEEELLVPDGPQGLRGYITSRETKELWSEEEIERWLTLPSEKELSDLKSANDKIASDIVGAAP